MPKAERCKVNGPKVQNPDDLVRLSNVVRKPNCLATELNLKTPKSERSDFGRSLYVYKKFMTLKIQNGLAF